MQLPRWPFEWFGLEDASAKKRKKENETFSGVEIYQVALHVGEEGV